MHQQVQILHGENKMNKNDLIKNMKCSEHEKCYFVKDSFNLLEEKPSNLRHKIENNEISIWEIKELIEKDCQDYENCPVYKIRKRW